MGRVAGLRETINNVSYVTLVILLLIVPAQDLLVPIPSHTGDPGRAAQVFVLILY